MTGVDAWLIRAGNDNELIEPFRDYDLVAIGWPRIGDLDERTTRDAVKAAYKDTYPDHSLNRRRTNAGQLYRFAHEITEGDNVLTYDKTDREYHVGEVTGPYEYEPDPHPEGYPHVHTVNWHDTVSRDAFPRPVKNTLGGTLTVFSIDDRWDTIQRVISGETTAGTAEEGGDEPPYIENVEARADELISDIIANMDPYDFEALVAAVLRGMGYEARKTRDSHDHGVDVVAHPDSLGFEDPYIKVQVKRQRGTVGGPAMREFTGTLDHGEKGLYVATGGYTRDAQTAARSDSQRVELLDREDFIDLLIEHYDALEPEYQSLVPLRPVYLPTQDPPLRE